MASAVASAGRAAASRMVCTTLGTLRARMGPEGRIAGLDVTATHVTLSISDAGRAAAAPLGVLRRSGSAAADARILAGALARGDAGLRAVAVVVGAPPGAPPNRYVSELLRDPDLLPDAQSVVYYSEATAVRRAANAAADVTAAARAAAPAREARKRHRFDTAMFPDIDPDAARADRAARARVSATEILQAALDDLARLPPDGARGSM